MSSQTLTVGILLYPGFEVIDAFGPAEALGSTRFPGQKLVDTTPRPFHVIYLAERLEPLRAGNGGNVCVMPDATIAEHPHLDIVMVPGGLGSREEYKNQVLLDWLVEINSQVQIMASVCTGAVFLARAGLLKGLEATTNHLAYDWVTGESPPGIRWTKELRWVDEGHIITGAGTSAGIDMACYLVSRLLGLEIAEATVKFMEYNWERNPRNQPS